MSWQFNRIIIMALVFGGTGWCVAGPCAGKSLRAIPVKLEGGYVMLAGGVEPAAFE